MKDSEKKVDYLVTDSGLHFGIVKINHMDEFIIAGPVCIIRPNETTIHRIMSECSIPSKYTAEVENYFNITPSFSTSQVINLLLLINAYVNDQISTYENGFNGNVVDSLIDIRQKHSLNIYAAKENEAFHNSYEFEQEICLLLSSHC